MCATHFDLFDIYLKFYGLSRSSDVQMRGDLTTILSETCLDGVRSGYRDMGSTHC